MKLRKQLLCVSLVLLCLPWAGCQYLQEMDGILRQNQQQTLSASTEAIARVFSQQPLLLYPHGEIYTTLDQQSPPIYFPTLSAPVWVDGYEEGWEDITAVAVTTPDQSETKIRYRSGFYHNQLHLFVEVTDSEVIYNNPTKSLVSDGDRLVLVTGDQKKYIFSTAAPGKIVTKSVDKDQNIAIESSINAYWQDSSQGYNLEISLPTSLTSGRLSFYLVDQNSSGITRLGPHVNSNTLLPPWYIVQPEQLAQQLEIFSQPGLRHKIIDPYLWTLAEQGSTDIKNETKGNWLIKKLYRALLNSQNKDIPKFFESNHHSERTEVSQAFSSNPDSAWYMHPTRSNYYILSSAAPITHTIDGENRTVGVVVTEQSSAQLAALTDSAFSRLLFLSMGAICLVALGLLGYASWLSWRIRQLSLAASAIVSHEGKVLDTLPQTRAADEIGDLARNYGQLLIRIGDYTEYLQTLSRKLSHELRTPLAIIHSSLDNLHNQSLDNQSLDSQGQIYQQRAKEGATRLGTLLTAMSEASRVEESIEHAESEVINISDLLNGVALAYQDIYTSLNLYFNNTALATGQTTMYAAPDLLVQMLDKLIENAASFCPEGGCIHIGLSVESDHITITVANDGPDLPEKMRDQLFDNMVSVREKSNDASHLGLGLHIVNLIVKYHKGSIQAQNRETGNGVIFTIIFPQ
ncbi:MAG: ATP-binding protein [Oceanicoccus sp.]